MFGLRKAMSFLLIRLCHQPSLATHRRIEAQPVFDCASAHEEAPK